MNRMFILLEIDTEDNLEKYKHSEVHCSYRRQSKSRQHCMQTVSSGCDDSLLWRWDGLGALPNYSHIMGRLQFNWWHFLCLFWQSPGFIGCLLMMVLSVAVSFRRRASDTCDHNKGSLGTWNVVRKITGVEDSPRWMKFHWFVLRKSIGPQPPTLDSCAKAQLWRVRGGVRSSGWG